MGNVDGADRLDGLVVKLERELGETEGANDTAVVAFAIAAAAQALRNELVRLNFTVERLAEQLQRY